MEQVKGHFLEEIISGKYTQQEIMRKADFIQLDLIRSLSYCRH